MADPYADIGSAAQSSAPVDPYASIGAPAPQAAADPDAAWHGWHTVSTGADGQMVATPVAAPDAPAQPSTGIDAAKSVGSGLITGFAGMADQLNPARIVEQGVKVGLSLAGAPKLAEGMAPYIAPGVNDAAVSDGLDYKPQTTVGRYAKAIAQFAPNLIMGPEGAAPKIAAAVVPGVASEGAADLTAAMGGGPGAQEAARFGGALAGGIGSAGAANALTRAPRLIAKEAMPAAKAIQAAIDVTGAPTLDIKTALTAGKLPVAASPGLTQLGEAVTTLPGPGQVAIRDAVGARSSTQTDRALQALQDHLAVDPTTARGDIDALIAKGRQSVGPGYDAIRANPAPVWNTDLAELAQRPAIKKAIGVAANDLLNAGESPTAAGLALDPDTGWGIASATNPEATVVEQQPTAATWIKVHQALGRTVDRSPITNRPIPDSVSPGNYGISQAGASLKAALAGDSANNVPGAIPGYADVLNKSGDYLSTANAFDRAKGKLFTGSVHDFNTLWGSLGSDAEKNAARSALANEVLEVADRNQNGLNPGLFRAPGVQKKLAIAFGDDAAQKFTDQMESNASEKAAYNQITGGPQTAARLALLKKFQEQNPPKGISGMAGKALGAAEWAQTIFHPTLLATKIAHGLVNKAGGAGKTAALPWEDPAVNEQLGQLLSDPTKMSAFLDLMGEQNAANVSAEAARRSSLLSAPRLAAPAAFSGSRRKASERKPSRP